MKTNGRVSYPLHTLVEEMPIDLNEIAKAKIRSKFIVELLMNSAQMSG